MYLKANSNQITKLVSKKTELFWKKKQNILIIITFYVVIFVLKSKKKKNTNSNLLVLYEARQYWLDRHYQLMST